MYDEQILHDIFRTYNIRGIYPDQVNEKLFYDIARACAIQIPMQKAVVGADVRASSDSLKEAFIKGLVDSGVAVVDGGEMSTDVMYYISGHHDFDFATIITASHNPKEYNGLKMMRKGVDALMGPEYTRLKEQLGNLPAPNGVKGKVTKQSFIDEFIDFSTSLVPVSNNNLHIVIDCSGGSTSLYVPRLAQHLGWKIDTIYATADGSFSHHSPNPLEKGACDPLRKEVMEKKADLGVINDADGDRSFFIDAAGEMVSGAYTVALLAKQTLKTHPGATIVHDNRLVWAIEDTIKENGGISQTSPSGYVFIRENMRKYNAVFGGELSCHLYYKETTDAENGIVSLLKMASMVANEGPLASLIAPYQQKYFMSDEINFKNVDFAKVKERVMAKYQNERIEENGGLLVSGKDFRFNLRKSDNEPLVRLTLESRENNVQALVSQVESLLY